MFIKLASNNQTSRLLGFPRVGKAHKYPLANTNLIQSMKNIRDRLYTLAQQRAIIAADHKVVLGLGDDELDQKSHHIEIEEAIVDIEMPEIADIPARSISVVLAGPKSTLEVMATVDQLTYLSNVLSRHIDKRATLDAAIARVDVGGAAVVDEIVSEADEDVNKSDKEDEDVVDDGEMEDADKWEVNREVPDAD